MTGEMGPLRLVSYLVFSRFLAQFYDLSVPRIVLFELRRQRILASRIIGVLGGAAAFGAPPLGVLVLGEGSKLLLVLGIEFILEYVSLVFTSISFID